MYVDRVLFPVTALGPGERIAIWMSGCNRHCEWCANPELWERKKSQSISVERMKSILLGIASGKDIRLTITGGEPFDQAEELAEMIEVIASVSDVQIYTGYYLEELEQEADKKRLLTKTDVLIDGPYIDKLNKEDCVLRGSENQQIRFLNPKMKSEYENYMKRGRQIQNVIYDHRMISVGIHNNDRERK